MFSVRDTCTKKISQAQLFDFSQSCIINQIREIICSFEEENKSGLYKCARRKSSLSENLHNCFRSKSDRSLKTPTVFQSLNTWWKEVCTKLEKSIVTQQFEIYHRKWEVSSKGFKSLFVQTHWDGDLKGTLLISLIIFWAHKMFWANITSWSIRNINQTRKIFN